MPIGAAADRSRCNKWLVRKRLSERPPPTDPKAEGQRMSRTGGRQLGPYSHTAHIGAAGSRAITVSNSEGKLGPPVVPQLSPSPASRTAHPPAEPYT